jgi:hypothetical protein
MFPECSLKVQERAKVAEGIRREEEAKLDQKLQTAVTAAQVAAYQTISQQVNVPEMCPKCSLIVP